MALSLRNRRLNRAHSIDDLRTAARRRLPRAVFDFADGAAEDETTLAANRAAFQRYDFLPRVFQDVSHVDLTTTVLGQTVASPIIVAPTGLPRLIHPQGERAIARAAARAETIYTLSAMGSTSIEDVAAVSSGPKWFQVYVWRDRALVRDFFARCRAAGYHALCITVDVPVLGQRERDLRNGMTIPPQLTASAIFDAALHPAWWWGFLTSKRVTLASVVAHGEAGRTDVTTLGTYVNSQFDPSVTWDDLAWMVAEWDGPLTVKGILRPDDARRAVDLGARGIIVSNHGGRQLDGAIAALDALPAVVQAVGHDAEVILDGGIRRGADIVKALALGARACMTGRPYLYGLGAAGEPGVDRALNLLQAETRRAMALVGCTRVDQLDESLVRRRLPWE